jgi:uncharacterized protein YbjT (DUF2867 family)
MKLLILGGTGFVGRALAGEAVARGGCGLADNLAAIDFGAGKALIAQPL